MATTLPTSAEGMVDRLTPNVPMLILLAHLFDGDGEGICAEPCVNREAQWPACGRAASPRPVADLQAQRPSAEPQLEAALSCACHRREARRSRVAAWLTPPRAAVV